MRTPFAKRLGAQIAKLQEHSPAVTMAYVARALGVDDGTLAAWVSGAQVPHSLMQIGAIHVLRVRRAERNRGKLGLGHGGPRSKRYDGVDWSASDAAIAAQLGVTVSAVNYWRNRWHPR